MVKNDYYPTKHTAIAGNNNKTNKMIINSGKRTCKIRFLLLLLLLVQISACTSQGKEKPINKKTGHKVSNESLFVNQNTAFPQIHTNLNGMVREFVRTMYQDKKGNYWFGTNGDGIIRYDGQTLEKINIKGVSPKIRVLEIVEDTNGNMWFGTSNGLIKYDGKKYTTFSIADEEQRESREIWGLMFDNNGLLWVGSTEGLSQFNGETFTPFPLPKSMVKNPQYMLSDKLVFKIMKDNSGTIWFVTDGNGIFQYKKDQFFHLTTNNGLIDNNAYDIMEDKKGNIWIGTFYGGISKFDGVAFKNYTKDGVIDGVETGNLFEDSKGNIWFTAEGYGVYRYDGNSFTQFTTKNGLTSNVVQSIYEDNKGQLWFGTWQGLSIFDGEKFVNAKDIEPWTN